ncbi:MAG: hypothetical protein IJZ39_02980 [Oscillospiraceae bacterium]|nr:hypothetical protein [Oscillospiraceae bacterium]
MEEELFETTPEEEIGYTPRPAWQVWGARIALVVFVLILIVYYANIAGGGF